jgi:N-acyl-D-amino-acid deacylase
MPASPRSTSHPPRSPWALPLLLGLFLAAGCSADLPPDPGPFDLVIRGALVVDGTGAPAFRADLGVTGDRIVRVAREGISEGAGAREIDATGLVVAPGFIDLHAHLDPLLRLPGAESHVRQGVTTALGGPDGTAPLPLAPYLDSARALGVGMNVGFLAGHNSIRREVIGLEDRAPTAEELQAMRGFVAAAMEEGAYGLSTGLRYIPGAFSQVDEVVALSEVAARSGGIYTSHLREEGLGLMEGVAEALEIGRRAEIPVILTHHKVVGYPMWGSSERTLAMVDSARAAGTDVMIDQYPYTATYTGITILVPEWAMGGGNQAFLARMNDPLLADSILAGIRNNLIQDRGGNDLDRVQLARVGWDPTLEGGTLGDWADREGMPRTMETGALLVVEAIRRGGVSAIYHALHEDDVQRILRHPMTAVASDGRLVEPGDGHPHPRWYGTFPRVLGVYVRELGVLSLEEAVRKMTSLPADRMGLAERGRIREGAFADLVVFDPATVADRATFVEPHQYPEGIPWVVVNGVVTVEDGVFRDLRPGRVLRRGDP